MEFGKPQEKEAVPEPSSAARVPVPFVGVKQEPLSPPKQVKPASAEAIPQEPAHPAAISQEPEDPAAITQEPAHPAAISQEPEDPAAITQEPAHPAAISQEPVHPAAIRQEPVHPAAISQEPAHPKTSDGLSQGHLENPVKKTRPRAVFKKPACCPAEATVPSTIPSSSPVEPGSDEEQDGEASEQHEDFEASEGVGQTPHGLEANETPRPECLKNAKVISPTEQRAMAKAGNDADDADDGPNAGDVSRKRRPGRPKGGSMKKPAAAKPKAKAKSRAKARKAPAKAAKKASPKAKAKAKSPKKSPPQGQRSRKPVPGHHALRERAGPNKQKTKVRARQGKQAQAK